ncbi:antigen 5 like allergen Cul n 1 [Drosophila willistoni]|uniref:antigen 5 like allergen Cul n 1 n=1 Tax=Drosophila willistoni TaxID=7260 RepID=UPI001F08729B|nr:antigen 5 like allergen Cul n 1 [Drosophila willistoni]
MRKEEASDFCDKSICPKNLTSHIGCNNPNTWAETCGTNLRIYRNTHAIVHYILRKHNTFRNIVAGGYLKMFPTSGRMLTMEWSKELAQIAKWAAKRCTSIPPTECISTVQYRNPGFKADYNKFKGDQEILKIVESILQSWYRENMWARSKTIINGVSTENHEIGHFLQLIIGEVDRIGCAISRYTKEEWNHQLLVCIYSDSIRDFKKPVYQIDNKPTSHCKCGVNQQFQNLCSRRESFNL